MYPSTHVQWTSCTQSSTRYPVISRNLLLNVGPTADGRLDPLFEERLLDIGAWMDVSCEPNNFEYNIIY